MPHILLAQPKAAAAGLQVLVFQTSLYTPADVEQVAPTLDQEPGILRWTIDLHDADRVLRVETHTLQPVHITALLARAGYACQELPD